MIDSDDASEIPESSIPTTMTIRNALRAAMEELSFDPDPVRDVNYCPRCGRPLQEPPRSESIDLDSPNLKVIKRRTGKCSEHGWMSVAIKDIDMR